MRPPPPARALAESAPCGAKPPGDPPPNLSRLRRLGACARCPLMDVRKCRPTMATEVAAAEGRVAQPLATPRHQQTPTNQQRTPNS